MIRRPPQRNMPPNMSSWGQWVESELADIRASTIVQGQSIDRALMGTNASLTAISGQIDSIAAVQEGLRNQQIRMLETTTIYSWNQTTPYTGYGPSQTIKGPKWANFAMVVTGAIVHSSTIGGGVSRLTLMNFATTPTITNNEYDGSLQGSLEKSTVFPRQPYPQLVLLNEANSFISRTYSAPLGATSGSANTTFTHSITWIA